MKKATQRWTDLKKLDKKRMKRPKMNWPKKVRQEMKKATQRWTDPKKLDKKRITRLKKLVACEERVASLFVCTWYDGYCSNQGTRWALFEVIHGIEFLKIEQLTLENGEEALNNRIV